MTKVYNTTQLNPDVSFERHVYHRDQFAHYLRWTHVLKRISLGQTVLDFGSGIDLNLAEVLYRNMHKQKAYLGLDIRQLSKKGEALVKTVDWIKYSRHDLVNDNVYQQHGTNWDFITSFEVIEHIGKQNADKFLENIFNCSNEKTIILLSTPVYSESVGAAGNHTYDSGDGRGVAPQEFTYSELEQLLQKYFSIEEVYGTFASQKDYKPVLNDWQSKMFEALNKYYDSNLVSNIMAPLFPKESRNCLWVLKRK